MGPTALLLHRRKACWWFFHPEKSWQLWPGLNPRNWVLKGNTLALDHRSRSGAGYQAMLFKILEQYCICLFLSNRPVTKPGLEEPSRVVSQVVPPTSEMAQMSLQDEPPVHKAGTSLQEQPPVHKTGTKGKQWVENDRDLFMYVSDSKGAVGAYLLLSLRSRTAG